MSDAVLPVEAPAKKGSYFARHWRGELSLAKSWWVNGVLLTGVLVNGAILGALIGVANVYNQSHLNSGTADMEALVYLALAVTSYVWWAVGIWRSAGNYKGPAVWKWWAWIAICLGIVLNLWLFAHNVALIVQAATTPGHTLMP
jgi:hypothetical protein